MPFFLGGGGRSSCQDSGIAIKKSWKHQLGEIIASPALSSLFVKKLHRLLVQRKRETWLRTYFSTCFESSTATYF